MILKDNILSLLRYNAWANSAIHSAIPESFLDIEIKSSFNSIRKTICHIWDAETIWFERLQKIPVTPWPASNNFKGSWEEMKVAILDQETRMIAFFSDQPDAFFIESIRYKNLKGLEFTNLNFQVLQHVVNHSSAHRGQIITMLRHLECTSIPSTDLIAYYRETNVAS